jgi:hypothetical protein
MEKSAVIVYNQENLREAARVLPTLRAASNHERTELSMATPDSTTLNYHLQKWAHKELTLAVRKGLIAKPHACQECGRLSKLCAHHHDYARPFDVKWLCYSCHAKEHPERYKQLVLSSIARPSPKMKKAIEWLRQHPEHLETESRVLAEMIGVSHTLANDARKVVKYEMDNEG